MEGGFAHVAINTGSTHHVGSGTHLLALVTGVSLFSPSLSHGPHLSYPPSSLSCPFHLPCENQQPFLCTALHHPHNLGPTRSGSCHRHMGHTVDRHHHTDSLRAVGRPTPSRTHSCLLVLPIVCSPPHYQWHPAPPAAVMMPQSFSQ